MAQEKALIVGGGLGGLATAALLGKMGYSVTVVEKNAKLGGRANIFEADGFTFDMGPSWYLMPDVFAHFFALMGEKVEDHLELIKLAPSYRIFFKDKNLSIDITGDLKVDLPKFEKIEPGCSANVRKYLKLSEQQYKIAMEGFIYKNYDSVFDFFTLETLVKGSRLHVFEKMDKYARRFFKTEEMLKIMEYTLVFLGSSPYNTPALYNIMSHVDFNMGVFYPQGGLYKLVEALVAVGTKHGVTYRTEAPVSKIMVEQGKVIGVELEGGEKLEAPLVVSNTDRAHTELKLLSPRERDHSEAYWKKATLAPSGFVLYLGVKSRVKSLIHHNLIFSEDWEHNFDQVFDHPALPDDPSFYVCAPSVTDPSVAPANCENLFVLVPIAAGLTLTNAQQEDYASKIIETMEKDMGVTDLSSQIIYQRIYSIEDFKVDYNSNAGTALGMAHTLFQSAIFRPNNVSKKVKGLYYVGADTNPGIGMPMTLISAELVIKRLRGDKSGAPLSEPLAK